jgi:hypothetical protein
VRSGAIPMLAPYLVNPANVILCSLSLKATLQLAVAGNRRSWCALLLTLCICMSPVCPRVSLRSDSHCLRSRAHALTTCVCVH